MDGGKVKNHNYHEKIDVIFRKLWYNSNIFISILAEQRDFVQRFDFGILRGCLRKDVLVTGVLVSARVKCTCICNDGELPN